MLEENKMDYEKDICCPSSVAPSEEAIKDEDCKNCLIRTSCQYINSDAPKSKKKVICNGVMSSYLKQLRVETEIERKQQKKQEQKATAENESSKEEPENIDAIDLIDEILGIPKKTPEEKKAYLEEVKQRREKLEELTKEIYEWQMFRRPYLLEAEERAKRDWEARKKSASTSVDEKLHDLMHKESSLEVDRQRVRKNTNTNTNNK